ncbi:hypothetical protein [Granulicella sp. dw_53]|uniref:hypothetical protein n=1 Tax=Granulicella sp. dw_53 TaxID=2719792 RepID=UPI001BD592EE|nr:hypothetical protein [Granulicella sp. dw_53]
MISLISLNGNTVSVVSLPATSGAFQSVEWNNTTAVANVSSIFTGQVQTQQWPGADMRYGTATLPPMTQAQARPWKAALMQLQGMSNAFQLGDPMGAMPTGTVLGNPLVDNVTTPVGAGSQTFHTKGWAASQINLLLPGDYIQIGFRLHTVLDSVVSDSSGKAPINIWPSLREVPLDGLTVVTHNPVGLFRLANNKVTWSEDVTKLTRLSFQFQEYR